MTSKIIWPKFQSSVEPPGADEIHLWQIDLDEFLEDEEKSFACLSPAEKIRAERFLLKQHRRRYVAAKSWTRRVLGAYLKLEPANVPLKTAPGGKPFIAAGKNPADLRFNLSHCENFALLAVATRREVGVDLQGVSSARQWPDIAKRFFTPDEFEFINRLPPANQHSAFAETWTRKEAAGKALTTGLSRKIFSLEVGPASWGNVACGKGLRVWSLPKFQNHFLAAMATQD